MNIEEYNRRVDTMHSVTGVPTYWEELQQAIAKLERYKYIAKMFYDNRFEQDPEQNRYAAEAYEREIAKDER